MLLGLAMNAMSFTGSGNVVVSLGGSPARVRSLLTEVFTRAAAGASLLKRADLQRRNA
jgi:hypothetical protein